MKKRIVSLMAVIIALFGFSVPVYATSKTSDDAINWVRSKEYQTIGSGQCVALIAEYYNFLGVNSVWGNACDYATNSLPNGWTREKGGVPQKGDILIYTGGYGHVAIAETTQYSWHQNWGGTYVQWVDQYYSNSFYSSYEGVTKTYWGCIRPNFADTSDTQAPTVNNLRASNVTAQTITISADLSDNVGVTRVWLNIYGPSGSKGYAVNASNGTFTHTINTSDYGGSGLYTVHLYAFDNAGNETGTGIYDICVINDTIPPTDVGMICDFENMTILPNTKVTLEFWYNDATSFDIVIDRNGVEYKRFNNVNSPFYFTPTEDGEYLAKGYAKNNAGTTESNRRRFYVKSTKPSITNCTVTEISKSFLVNIDLENIPNSSIIILASYQNNKLATIESRVYSTKSETYIIADDIDKVKVMVWNNLNSQTPICESKTISSDEFL